MAFKSHDFSLKVDYLFQSFLAFTVGLACLFVGLFVSNKRQNYRTDYLHALINDSKPGSKKLVKKRSFYLPRWSNSGKSIKRIESLPQTQIY